MISYNRDGWKIRKKKGEHLEFLFEHDVPLEWMEIIKCDETYILVDTSHPCVIPAKMLLEELQKFIKEMEAEEK